MTSFNIASHLPAMAAAQPDTLAVAIQGPGKDYPRYSYRELDQVSDRIARGLQEVGIVKGTRTVLMVKPGLEYFALVFALFKVGAVLVAIDPGMGTKNLSTCLREAEPEAFIGIRRAHLARLLFGWGKPFLKINIVVEPWLLFGLVMPDMPGLARSGSKSENSAMHEMREDDNAAILFTSGSTGVPKGVCYTHGNFSAQVSTLRSLYGIKPGEIDLATFPLFALFAPAMGMSSIIPDMDFTQPGRVDPTRIYNAVRDFGVTTMFGSPALLDRVGRWGVEHGKRLEGLRRVISAGAPVSPGIMQRFASLLENGVEIFTPYGATETLPVTSIGSREVLEETARKTAEGSGVCVGKAVAGTTVKIIAISDEPIEDIRSATLLGAGEVGEIIVRGPQVTASYFNRERSNELAKIMDDNGGFFHRMGDLGYLDTQGRLWFCGRKSERVELENMTMFTICCEGVFNTHPRVTRTALVKIKEQDKDKPALCVELEADSQHTDQRVVVQELLDLGNKYPHVSAIRHILIHPGFPVDIRHNAKIGRAELADWAQQQL